MTNQYLLKLRKMSWVGYILIIIGILVLIHHYIIHGYWFDYHNLFSHEAIITCLIGLGFGILIGLKEQT